MACAVTSMLSGAVAIQLLSVGIWLLVPEQSRAAWGWQCTYYSGNDHSAVAYMDVGADDGPTCSDNTKLTCNCSAKPCGGPHSAYVSSLSCAGAGDDTSTDGCFKLHHSYGKAQPLRQLAGPGQGDQGSACGDAPLLKVYGSAAGLGLAVDWGMFKEQEVDNSSEPESAAACQELCSAEEKCAFFSYNDQNGIDGAFNYYDYFQGICMLFEELACAGDHYGTYQGVISGPKECSTIARNNMSRGEIQASLPGLLVSALAVFALRL
eukprot:TRINITY_DN36111_c0_g1_i1.p1 TRINITY_DN36111_c0_g1~~TRINITY_DN36111_c0_g1_i1.p1  ORF type:complete len:288 (-),score=62.87 TRINITY_DN36111_c0_g1_i1:510-1304(-)